MKKAFAIFMVVILLTTVMLPLCASAAYTKPAELASAFDVGVWPMAAGTYDPGLDGNGIPDGVYVYGLFDASYAMLEPPASIAGFEAAASPADMTPGTYYVLTASSGFGYVLVMSEDGPAEAAPAPAVQTPAPAVASGDAMNIYVSVVVDGVLLVAGQPMQVAGYIHDALIAISDKYGPDGAAGYSASTNNQWQMFIIEKFWGREGVPFVIIDGSPIGADAMKPTTVDQYVLEDGMEIICTVAGITEDGASYPTVSMTYSETDESIAALRWIFNTQTYSYTSEPFQEVDVVDAETGKVLGQTNAMGRMTLLAKNIPSCGVVAIAGVSAVPVGTPTNFTPVSTQYVPPRPDYSLFGGAAGQSLLNIVIISAVLMIPLAAIVLHAQRKEIRNRGRKFTQPLVKK